MRLICSITGILILFANLACASLCAAPKSVPPPCHQQHDDGAEAKPCDQLSWAGETSPFVLAPAFSAEPVASWAKPVAVTAVFLLRAPAPSPPPIWRI